MLERRKEKGINAKAQRETKDAEKNAQEINIASPNEKKR
jgi:hypothetical protein